jgi:hypothetical protein
MGKEGDKPLFLVKNKRLVYLILVQVVHCVCVAIFLRIRFSFFESTTYLVNYLSGTLKNIYRFFSSLFDLFFAQLLTLL